MHGLTVCYTLREVPGQHANAHEVSFPKRTQSPEYNSTNNYFTATLSHAPALLLLTSDLLHIRKMTTSFSCLPIVDVRALREPQLSDYSTEILSKQLYDVFATTGFAYLTNPPLSFDHDEIFKLTREFFDLPLPEKMRLAKRSFRPGNENTYRG